jgi:hypothetical protein
MGGQSPFRGLVAPQALLIVYHNRTRTDNRIPQSAIRNEDEACTIAIE